MNFDSNNILNVTLTKLLKTDFTEFDSSFRAVEYTCKLVSQALNVDRVSVWAINEDTLVSKFIFHKGEIVNEKTYLHGKDCPNYLKAVKAGLPILANQARIDEKTREFKENYFEPLDIFSLLDVPIHEKGKLTGLLSCEHLGEERIWKESEVYFASLVAGLMSLVNSLFKEEEAKEKLKEERLLLRAIVDNLPFHVFVKDSNHKWILSNKETLKYTGAASEGEILGKENKEFLLRDAAEATRVENDVILETGEPLLKKETFHVRPADLSLRKFLVSKFPLRNVKNEITGVIGIAEDITERTHIEELLKESEEQFKFISENTSDGITVMQGGVLTYYSPSCEKISGFNYHEMLEFSERDLLSFIHPEDRAEVLALGRKAIVEKRKSLVVKHRVRHKSGDYYWREDAINLIYNAAGEHAGTIVIIRDISASVDSEFKLKENEHLLSEILHSLTEAVWAMDFAAYKLTFVSKSFENLFGYSFEEWREKPEMWMDVIHKDDRHFIETVLNDVKNKEFHTYTLRVYDKEGNIRWVENRGNIILDELGRPKVILGMSVDITDKVIALKKLEKSEKRLSVILNSLDEIVWAVKLPSREPLFISDSFETVFGISSQKWHDDYGVWLEYATEESKEEGRKMINDLFSTGYSKGFLQIRDANNNLKSLKCLAKYVFDENGERDMMLGISLDITEQVESQNKLKNSERRLVDILNSLDEAVWAASIPESEPLFVSKSFEEFYGFNLEEWKKDWLLWEAAVHPDDKHLIANFREKIFNYETVSGTCRIVSREGKERWVYNLAKTVRDENGEPYMVLGIAVDVTAKKESERELGEVKNKALKAEMAMAELELKTLQMQMNPHFIFNSLNSIQSFILKNDVISTNDYLTKFARLIRSFLDSSRSVKIRLREEIKLLQLYVEMEQMRFADKFDFKINVGPDVDTLVEVPSMMLQPFVENAINHGIRYKQEKGLLAITFENQGDSLLCKIEDDGVGADRANEILDKTNKGYISQGLKITAERLMTYNAIHKSHITYDVSNLNDKSGVKDVGTSVKVSFPLNIP
ncbi:PAS domain S-box protein [Arcticibacterium luteifluviistationis]|uniref:PAS domain S-box protein n=1 Tax=Arcticibacterium luteifluviistationis TaxID=1784714 RepID=UPI0013A70009|nr:PAS domain S-box protein [Arcticibacterium luteifluviistationis]